MICVKIEAQLSVTYTMGLFAEDASGKLQSSCDFLGISEKSHVKLEITCDELPGCLITENSTGMDTWSISTLANKCSVKWPTVAFTKSCPPGVQKDYTIQVKVTVVNPASPFNGRVGVMKYKLNTKSSTIFADPTGYTGGVVDLNTASTTEMYGIVLPAPQPTISVTGTAFCAGQAAGKTVTATLANVPAGCTIDWGNANITTNGTIAAGATSATGNIGAGLTTTASNIKATLKNASGTVVATSANYTVTVNPKPTLSVTPANPSVCSGAGMTLTANLNPSGTKFVWKKGGAQVGTAKTLNTGNLTANTSYEVTGTSAANCVSDPQTVTVTVKPVPTVTLAASKNDACSGEDITLTATASAADSYTWTNASGTSATATVKPTATTKYGVVATKDGCSSTKAETTVTIHKVAVSVSANPTSVAFSGTSTLTAVPTFTPSGNSVKSYTWTGKIDGTTSGPTLNSVQSQALTTNETFEVEVEDNMGCKGKGSVRVTVSGSALEVNPSGGGTFCTSVLPKTLDAGVAGGSGTASYTWTSTPAGLNLSSTSVERPDILATSSEGTYTVEVTVQKGLETKKGSLTVTVNKTPDLGALTAQPASLKEGESSQLTLASVNPTTADLVWSSTNGGPLAGTTGMSVSTGPMTAAGSFTYKVTATNKGCSAEKTVSVTTAGIPQLVITPPAGTPSGRVNTPFTSSVGVTGGEGGYTYVWSSGDPTVTLTDKGNGQVEIVSSTPGSKEICVKVTSGKQTVDKCFNVVVVDATGVSLVMSVDKKCAYDGEFLTISIVGTGADSYSFILRNPSNAPVMTVTDQTTWSDYKVYTTAAGEYKITDFKYKISGVVSDGAIPAPVDARFDPVPDVKAVADRSSILNHCEGEMLTLKGSSDDAGLNYTWDNGVTDGVPFVPTTGGVYTVTAVNPATGCQNTATVEVVLRSKPVMTVPAPQEICAGELVTLQATGSADVTFTWDNGVVDGQPFKPALTATYTVIGSNADGCTVTDSTVVTVNQPPHIERTSKNPRNIAIGKDVYFAVTASGEKLNYTWKRKNESGEWETLQDITNNTPIIIGSRTDSINLMAVPKIWDGTELRCVVSGDCGADSTDFQLNVRECFEITTDLVMGDGILADENPGNGIDGWYCQGQEITLKALILSEEEYEIENAHYVWQIDGLDFAEEHRMEADTAILTWVPSDTLESDIVVRVKAYCDGACEEVMSKRLRLKARPFADVVLKLMSDAKDNRFCAGDTVQFWVNTGNPSTAGEHPEYTWYNDIFKLPEDHSPKNELISYDGDKLTMVMGQEDTWMRVVLDPSVEICTREPLIIDTVFMKRKPWMEPELRIDCSDTLVCRGDSVIMTAVQANAGEHPTYQWQRSVGEPMWNLGTDYFATVFVDESDVWVKCTLTPSDDICYDQTEPIVDVVKIAVFQDSSEVTISCDMSDKQLGDELVFEAEVRNMLGVPRYEWYVNEMKAPCTEPEYITSDVPQGAIVYCLVSGSKVCQTNVRSNEIRVDYGMVNRDTMLVIYRNENVRDLNMLKEGDDLTKVMFRLETPAKFGTGSISLDGQFNYTPMNGFIGADEVKYTVVDRRDKSVLAEGYIYITVKESDRFFVPNIITPNGDGINDTWVLEFLKDYPNHLVLVFDRSGRIVFEARNYQNDWNGEGMTKSGYVGHINLVNGIYTYIIDLGDANKTVLKSWIEIRANMNRRNYR